MAWETKYSGTFYNIVGDYVIVRILEEDYAGSTITIKVKDVTIETNNQKDTPVVGLGATVKLQNTETFNYYDDLLTNYERQFKCKIIVGSDLYFEGYMICDLNEQVMLEYSTITLRFTNYLRRMENTYLPSFDISNKSSLMDIINDVLELTALNPFFDYVVNSSLFHEGMDSASTDTFLEQTYISNDVFYKNPQEINDCYTMINKALQSFNIKMYYYDGNWVFERYNDVERAGNWVQLDQNSDLSWGGTSVSSLKQELNKQTDEIEYVGGSQVLIYDSGMQKIIVDIFTKEFDSLVFNAYDDPIPTVTSIFPVEGILILNKWHAHENYDIYIRSGYNIGHIKRYIYVLGSNNATDGLVYGFSLQLNETDDTVLGIKFKAYVGSGTSYVKLKVRFTIKLGHLDYALQNLYLYETSSGNIEVGSVGDMDSTETQYFEFEFTDDDSLQNGELNISKKLNLENIKASLNNPETFYFSITNIWYQNVNGGTGYLSFGYFGDFQVKINPDVIENEITATINEDFVKTKEITLPLSDISNLNYKNGLEYKTSEGAEYYQSDDYERTSAWVSDDNSASDSLVNVYLGSLFKNLAKTTRKIDAKIRYGGYIKPFAIFTDDNIQDGTSTNIKFLVTNYRLDLVRAEYDLEMEEYLDEDIIISET